MNAFVQFVLDLERLNPDAEIKVSDPFWNPQAASTIYTNDPVKKMKLPKGYFLCYDSQLYITNQINEPNLYRINIEPMPITGQSNLVDNVRNIYRIQNEASNEVTRPNDDVESFLKDFQKYIYHQPTALCRNDKKNIKLEKTSKFEDLQR